MKLRSLCFAGIIATSGIVFDAHAMPTWTVTATGNISNGFDYSGVFGVAGRDLTGLTYKQTLTASIDPSQYVDRSAGPTFVGLNGSVPTLVNVTVDGVTLSLAPTINYYSQQYLAKRRQYIAAQADQIYSYANSGTLGKEFFEASNNLVSYSKGFVPNLDFSQSLSITPDPSFSGGVLFYIMGSNSARFTGNINLFEINVEADIPEPGSLALIGLGVFAMVRTRRRKF